MTNQRAYLASVLAVLAAAALWGSTGTLQAMLPDAREPLVVGAARLAVGALSLLVLALSQGAARRAFRRLPIRPLLTASTAICAYNMLFFAAVIQAGVGLGTAITIGSAPLWVALFERLWLGLRPSPRKLAGQGLAIVGAALLVISGQAEAVYGFGLLLAAAAGLCYATYSLVSSAMSQCAPPSTIAAATFTLAALFALPVFAILPVAWALEANAWPYLIALGVVSTGLAYALYTWGLKAVPASTAVTLALAEPLTAWLLATVIVGEPTSALKLLGAALLLAGLYVVTSDKRAEGL